MRILFAVVLAILALCPKSKSDSKCDGDLSEALYEADAILLARVKKVTKARSVIKYKISVSKVLKESKIIRNASLFLRNLNHLTKISLK